jgi:rhodanese-related sulfurtransferase
MKKIKILLISFLFAGSMFAQQSQVTSPRCENEIFDKAVREALSFSMPVIDVNNLKKNINDVVILDAREKEEFEISHIPGAKWIGYSKINEELLDQIDKNQKIILYCSIGYRSEKVAEKLKEKGFSKVYNLFGSIFEWSNRGYPLEDINQKSTNKVHTYNKKWSRLVDGNKAQKIW